MLNQEQTFESWEKWLCIAIRVFHFQICFTPRIDKFDTFGYLFPLGILLNSQKKKTGGICHDNKRLILLTKARF